MISFKKIKAILLIVCLAAILEVSLQFILDNHFKADITKWPSHAKSVFFCLSMALYIVPSLIYYVISLGEENRLENKYSIQLIILLLAIINISIFRDWRSIAIILLASVCILICIIDIFTGLKKGELDRFTAIIWTALLYVLSGLFFASIYHSLPNSLKGISAHIDYVSVSFAALLNFTYIKSISINIFPVGIGKTIVIIENLLGLFLTIIIIVLAANAPNKIMKK